MVEKQSSCMEWEGPTPSIHRSYHRDRCIPPRMGGPLPRHLHWGTMIQARKPIPYKLPGTSSRIPSRPVFHKELGKAPGTAAYGQCNSSNLYKQDGGTHSPILSLLAKNLWDWCLSHNVLIKAQYIPGIQNVQADRESRIFLDSSDWKLHPAIFNLVYQRWGLLNIDLFASRLTFQLDQYVSWRSGPSAVHTDAFTPRLGNISGICVSPILSNWSVSTTCSESEGRTPCNSDSSLANTNMVSPITDTLHRFPYPIAGSGRPVDTRGQEPSPSSTVTSCVATINSSYQTGGLSSQTRTSSSQLGGKTPQVHIPQPGTSGVAVVLNEGQLIPFHHL